MNELLIKNVPMFLHESHPVMGWAEKPIQNSAQKHI